MISPVDRVDLGVPQGESLRKKSPSLSEISELIRFMLMMLKSSMELYSDFVDVSEDIDDIMYVCLRHMQRNANKRITIAPAKTDKRTVLTSLTIPDVSASLSLCVDDVTDTSPQEELEG